jgi:creatinine amidohydrolase
VRSDLASLTWQELEALCGTGRAVALVPVGSVEPHGPHLPLGTDTMISATCAARAIAPLAQLGIDAVVAPSVPYGVTDFARGFAGAIGVPAEALTALLRGVAERLLETGFVHVCFVNNHLEPEHDCAVRAVKTFFPERAISVACPLTRRWARTLSEEFRRGDCHAGRYETSLVLAAGEPVRDPSALEPLGFRLSEAIRAGITTFRAIGMSRAYTGDPASATREEGEELYTKLVTMVVTEITEALSGDD